VSKHFGVRKRIGWICHLHGSQVLFIKTMEKLPKGHSTDLWGGSSLITGPEMQQSKIIIFLHFPIACFSFLSYISQKWPVKVNIFTNILISIINIFPKKTEAFSLAVIFFCALTKIVINDYISAVTLFIAIYISLACTLKNVLQHLLIIKFQSHSHIFIHYAKIPLFVNKLFLSWLVML
jgi:hypothetical protein